MHRDYQALQQARSLRQQLKTLRGRVAANPLLEAIIALDTKLDELEGAEEGRTFLSTPQGRSLARLNVGLTMLLETVDSADAAPNTTKLRAFADVRTVLDRQLGEWEKIKKADVPDLNLMLKQSGLQPLNAESAAVIEQEWHSAEKAAGED